MEEFIGIVLIGVWGLVATCLWMRARSGLKELTKRYISRGDDIQRYQITVRQMDNDLRAVTESKNRLLDELAKGPFDPPPPPKKPVRRKKVRFL